MLKKTPSQELIQGPICDSCSAENAPGMKFCKMCGFPLEGRRGRPSQVFCASCGKETAGGFKFCQHCGTCLAHYEITPVVGEVSSMDDILAAMDHAEKLVTL